MDNFYVLVIIFYSYLSYDLLKSVSLISTFSWGSLQYVIGPFLAENAWEGQPECLWKKLDFIYVVALLI